MSRPIVLATPTVPATWTMTASSTRGATRKTRMRTSAMRVWGPAGVGGVHRGTG